MGASSPQERGNYYTWQQAQTACPDGWRLPTETEFELLVSSGIRETETGVNVANGRLFLPKGGGKSVNSNNDQWTYYWTNSSEKAILFFWAGSTYRFDNVGKNIWSFQVRCVKE